MLRKRRWRKTLNPSKLKQHLEKADGWVVCNLRREGNSVFPSSLIEIEADKRVGEKMLTCMYWQTGGSYHHG